jgi:DNA-binding CsgD family transcriptional regulator/tetratricopeptide (TPR) repeat protein
LVRGGPASNQSEVLKRFAESAQQHDVRLLRASGSRVESGFHWGAVDQLFRSPGVPCDVATRIASLTAESSTPPESAGIRVVQEVYAAFLDLARQKPVVIVVDDVQHIDNWSLRALLYVQRRMRSEPIMMVLNEWDRPDSSLAWFRTEMVRLSHRVVRLGPLSYEALADLLTRLLGPGAEAHRAEFHKFSGGNPMLVRALVEDHRAKAVGGSFPGTAYAEAVLTCLYRWEPELLAIAQALATLRDEATLPLVARMTGIDLETVRQAVGMLTSAGLLGVNQSFRHEVAETAVVESISTRDRTRLQLRAAELLHQRGAPAEKVARYLLTAHEAPHSWGVTVLREAAEQMMSVDDASSATRCLELALHACTDEDERVLVKQALAKAIWRTNPAAAAPYVAHLRDAVHAGTLANGDIVTVVRDSLWNGDQETTSKALALLSSAGGGDAQVEAELRLAYNWSYGSPSANGKYDATTAHDPWNRTADALARVWIDGGSESSTASAEHVLQSCRLGDTTLQAVGTAILALMYGGKADRAQWWCDRLVAEADRRRAVTWQAMLRTVRASISLRRGEAATAAQEAEAAFGMLSARSWGVLIGYPLTVSLLANTALGRYDAAGVAFNRPVPEAMFNTLGGLRYLHARGHYYLATGRTLAAVSDFQRCGILMRERGLDLPVLVGWRADLAEANLQLGRVRVARDLARQQLNHSKTRDPRTKGVSYRVLAAASDLADRPPLLLDAVEQLQIAGDRLELAKSLSALGEAYQELGEFDRARLVTRRAGQEIKFCHAGSPEPQAAPAPEPVDTGPPLLSEAETRVAELAALGHTNREISSRLCVTVSTVEQHLTRIYRKLGVTSRGDLPARLTGRPR